MNRWPSAPLGDLLAAKTGSVNPTNFPDETFDLYSIPAYDSGKPEVRTGSEIGSAKQIVKSNDVLLSRIVPHIRRVWTIGEDHGRRLIASGEWIVFCSDRVRPDYLRYFLLSNYFHALFMRTVSGVGGSLLRAKSTEVAKIVIPVPPLAEQERLVKLLDEADALRKLRAQADRRIADFIPALFHEMFGDPAENPKGWPRASLGSLCELVNGAAFKPSDWDGSGLPIVRIQNLNDSTKTFNYTSKLLPEKFRVQPGDILLSWSGTPGTSFGCFRWNGPEGWLNQHIFNVRLAPNINGDFFIESVNIRLHELIAKAHGGVGLQHVTRGVLQAMEMLVPPIATQEQFAAHVTEIRALEAEQAKSRSRLDDLFQSMLHRAFSGEL